MKKLLIIKKKIFFGVLFFTSLIGLSGCGETTNKFTVKFDSNGGNEIQSIEVESGKSIEEPAAPFKNGYTFRFWSIDNNETSNKFEFSQTINKDINLYALWDANAYTITFDKQGGGNGSDSVSVKYDEILPDADAPEKEDHIFIGYYDALSGGNKYYNADMTSGKNYDIASNIILYAHWQISNYTITFDKQNGIGGSESVSAIYGNAMPTATAPTKEGYTFTGYYDSVSGGAKYYDADMNSEKEWDKETNTTLYARWEVIEYTITFDKQGGENGTESIKVTYNSSMPKATAPTKEGYTFTGYYDSISGGVQYYDTDMSSVKAWDKKENTVLYARWADSYFTPGLNFTLVNDTYVVDKGTLSGVIEVVIPKYYNGKLVTGIADFGFSQYYSMSSITLPDSITSIGKNAFDWCLSLNYIILPLSITSIDNYAFNDCDNLTIYTHYQLKPSGWNYSWNPDNRPVCWGTTSDVIDNYNNLQYIIANNEIIIVRYVGTEEIASIPTKINDIDVTTIGEYAFKNCDNLKRIMIPIIVKSIKEKAFYHCFNLTIYSESKIKPIDWDESWNYNDRPVYWGINQKYLKEYEDLLCYIVDNEITIIKYIGTASTVDIPTKINGIDVTSIGERAFADCDNLLSITIPNSVTNIEKYAFVNCTKLTTITMSDCLRSMGEYAFSNCRSLASVAIPNSVTSIGKYAFEKCYSLTSIIIPDGITIIAGYTFYNCDNLTSITIPNSVEIIGEYALYGCIKLTGITIPNSVEIIGEYAFSGCSNLTTITIPNSVEIIGKYAFYYCLTLTIYTQHESKPISWDTSWNPSNREVYWDMIFDDVNEYNGLKYMILNNEISIIRYIGIETTLNIPSKINGIDVTSIGDSAFVNCSNLISIIVPSSVINIGEYAFANCINLINIEIPDSVTNIGEYAFFSCSSLMSIVLPKGLTIIRYCLFSNCNELISVIIPDSVTNIENFAFYGCNSLTNITIPSSVLIMGDSVFYKCAKLIIYTEHLLKPTGWIYTWNYDNRPVHWGMTFDDIVEYNGLRYAVVNDEIVIMEYIGISTIVNIPAKINGMDVTGIENFAFYKCNDLTSITIQTNIIRIGEYAFYKCSNLINITISGTVTKVGKSAFYECSNLTGIITLGGLTGIENFAFYECSNLTSIIMLEGITKIGEYAFYNCSNLTSIAIPNSVTSIEEGAFAFCSNLTSITIPSSVTSIGEWVFSGCSNLSIYTEHQSKPKGWITSWNSSNQIYWGIMPDSIKEYEGLQYRIIDNEIIIVNYIGISTIVNIPSTINDIDVRSIGDTAFFGCSNLTSITIPSSVISIGDSAFENCNSLINITILEGVITIGEKAFSGCSSLTSIIIPNSVTSIGARTFSSCSSLADITISSSVTIIESYVFYNCSNLTNIIIPDSVTNIGERAFSYCSSLTDIIIPDSVISIESYAFFNCENLVSITIPSSVISIGRWAFFSCFDLTIYTQHKSMPAGWNTSWNYDDCPVVWDAK